MGGTQFTPCWGVIPSPTSVSVPGPSSPDGKHWHTSLLWLTNNRQGYDPDTRESIRRFEDYCDLGVMGVLVFDRSPSDTWIQVYWRFRTRKRKIRWDTIVVYPNLVSFCTPFCTWVQKLSGRGTVTMRMTVPWNVLVVVQPDIILDWWVITGTHVSWSSFWVDFPGVVRSPEPTDRLGDSQFKIVAEIVTHRRSFGLVLRQNRQKGNGHIPSSSSLDLGVRRRPLDFYGPSEDLTETLRLWSLFDLCLSPWFTVLKECPEKFHTTTSTQGPYVRAD